MLVDIVSNTFEFLTIVQHAVRGSEFRVRPFTDTHSAVRAQFGQQPSLMLVEFRPGKTIGPIRQVMVRGLAKVDQLLTLTMTAYNLTRLRTLAALRPALG